MVRSALLAAAVAVVPAALAASQKLTLHPSGFGEHSYAAWKAGEGLPDSSGNARQALYMQKLTETFANAAAVAEIRGVSGLPMTAVTGLEWEHRVDGWCGAGAPRWTTISTDATGARYVTHQGCAASGHSPGSAPNWLRDTQPFGPAGEPCVKLVPPFPVSPPAVCAANTISSMFIVFDEGTTVGGVPLGPGFVYLDNIKVTTTAGVHTWTSAADNGNA